MNERRPSTPTLEAIVNVDSSSQGRASLSTESEDGSVEDYDAFEHDPLTLTIGGKGGGTIEKSASPATTLEDTVYQNIKPSAISRPGLARLSSIPVTLNRLEGGHYLLTAEDEDLREVLRIGVERETNPSGAEVRRSRFSDLVFTRRFTTFDRQNVVSAESPFHGFFNLFWLGTAIYMLQIAAQNWREYGHVLGSNEIMSLMFHHDVLVLGLSDGVMCAATGAGLLLQKVIQRGYLSWNKSGWIIQSIWEALYLITILEWTLFRAWPWTHTVFFVLHGIVMLMKMHSFAFYNGYLSEEYKMRRLLEQKLKLIEHIAPVQSPSGTKTASWALSYLDLKPTATSLKQRRASAHDTSTHIGEVAATIESGEPLDAEQIQMFERIIKWEIDALTKELKGKCTDGGNVYPNNLTVTNHYEYIVLPTLVYELEYPRSDSINWYYVIEKAIAVLGILAIMNLVSQTFIYPVVVKALAMKASGMPLLDRLKVFPWMLSDLIFPFMLEYMMTWYVIWECILNLLAEITYFADRGFYADWWNSVSWDQFARDWNRPVHNFLLRHVYHSSISTMKVNKYTATLITFFLSACVHELVMWCIFKKLRGYLLFLQMMQIPLVQLSRSRALKGRVTLGNLIFWIGILTGPSLLCSLYLII